MNGQQAWIFPTSSISPLKESISFTATRNQRGHVMNEALNPSPLSTFVPPLLGDKSSLPAPQGRKTRENWIERAGKVESLTGNIWIPREGDHNCHHQEWEMQVQYLQRAGNSLWDCKEEVCLPLFWGPHAHDKANLRSWKTTGAHWKINATETERTATLWTLQLPHTALGAGGGEVSQSIHGCHWQ